MTEATITIRQLDDGRQQIDVSPALEHMPDGTVKTLVAHAISRIVSHPSWQNRGTLRKEEGPRTPVPVRIESILDDLLDEPTPGSMSTREDWAREQVVFDPTKEPSRLRLVKDEP